MRVEVVHALEGVSATEWDALVAPDDPFTEHAFLLLLERSGSVGAGTGWQPCHLLARDNAGALVGAMPLYLKTDSFGEFVFDWGWAEAAEAAGIGYYPKLVSAVPFTPVGGRRLLLADGPGRASVADALLDAAQDLAGQTGATSLHLLFVADEGRRLATRRPGFMPRLGYQFHWSNPGYSSFQDYLAAFRAPARKSVRRERRKAAASGLRLVTLHGEELSTRQWTALRRFYLHTSSRKWGPTYLTAEFFELLRQVLARRVVVTMALDGTRPVAGTLNLQRGRHLYGRYWGTLVQQDSLHFELCYHRPIELCIEQGWTRFEAGAQGTHKLKRGLLPRATHSVHWLRHPGLAGAVSSFLERERAAVRREIHALEAHGPFRRDTPERAAGRRAAGRE